jgi:hypothetical protein
MIDKIPIHDLPCAALCFRRRTPFDKSDLLLMCTFGSMCCAKWSHIKLHRLTFDLAIHYH